MKLFSRIIVVAVLLLSGVQYQAMAATYDSAANAYERRDYKGALREFTELSGNNDPYAQYMLGKMYATGEGIRKDSVTAYKWLHLSEQQGISKARKLKRKVSKKMSRSELDRAMSLVNEWRYSANNYQQLKDRKTVRWVQEQLLKRGYFNDKIDGTAGSRTRRSVRGYQQDHGMMVDGKITNALIISLNQDNETQDQSGYTDIVEERDDNELAVLRKKLRRLIRKAKKRNAAEPWLIDRLEELAEVEIVQWGNQVFRENFLSSNYQKGSGWRIVAGDFRLERGTGLIGTAVDGWGSSSGDVEDLAAILLESIIKQGRKAKKQHRSLAKIQNNHGFSNDFALRVETGPLESGDAFMLSCNTNESAFAGYRLVFQPEQWDQVKLLKVVNKVVTEIEGDSIQLSLDSDGPKTFEWTRSMNGLMRVLVNGRQLFEVRDNSLTKPFKHVSIAHRGGQVVLRDIQLNDSTGKTTML